MKTALRTILMTVLCAAAAGVLPSRFESAAQACPGCKTANETESLRPTAYMYSILFMLGMPATVFTGFGIAFYRMSRRATLEQMQLMQESENEAE